MKVYVRLAIVGVMVAGFAAGALAQQPPAAPAPQGPPAGPMIRQQRLARTMPDGNRAALIRAQIEERWGQRIQEELSLTDQQMDRLRAATRANEDRHRDFSRRESDLLRGVRDQLRPGVAANQDSLGRMLDALAGVRVQVAQSDQQELRELGQFLNPVQRARLLLMRRQLMDRIQEIRRDMPEGRMAPSLEPGLRGRMRPAMAPARRDSQPEEQP